MWARGTAADREFGHGKNNKKNVLPADWDHYSLVSLFTFQGFVSKENLCHVFCCPFSNLIPNGVSIMTTTMVMRYLALLAHLPFGLLTCSLSTFHHTNISFVMEGPFSSLSTV